MRSGIEDPVGEDVRDRVGEGFPVDADETLALSRDASTRSRSLVESHATYVPGQAAGRRACHAVASAPREPAEVTRLAVVDVTNTRLSSGVAVAVGVADTVGVGVAAVADGVRVGLTVMVAVAVGPDGVLVRVGVGVGVLVLIGVAVRVGVTTVEPGVGVGHVVSPRPTRPSISPARGAAKRSRSPTRHAYDARRQSL